MLTIPFAAPASVSREGRSEIRSRTCDRDGEGWAILTQEGNDEAWSDEVTRSADALFRLETELRLLAPTLVDDVHAATSLARSRRDLGIKPGLSDRDDLLSQYTERTRNAMKLMHELLGT